MEGCDSSHGNKRRTSCSCIVCGHSKEAKCSFFFFPKEEIQRKKWILKCQLPELTDVSSARLCAKHFKAEDFNDFNNTAIKRIRLKRGVIPSIFPDRTPSEKENMSAVKSNSCSRYCHLCRRRTTRHTRRLPKNENEANKWLEIFNITTRENVTQLKDMRFCEKHFEKTDENARNVHRRTLAFPKVIRESDSEGHEDEEEVFDESSTMWESESSEDPAVGCISDSPEVHDGSPTQPIVDAPVQPVNDSPIKTAEKSVVSVNALEIPRTPTTSVAFENGTVRKNRLIFPRHPGDIRSPHLSTPRSARRCLQITKDVISQKNAEVRSLKQQLCRARKRIHNLEEILHHLRNEAMLNEDMKESLMNDLPPVVAQMAFRKLRNRRELYSRELKRFALTLHFYSPKAYDFVRKTFCNLIPHPAHIRKWCCTSDGKPGFNKEVMETIRKIHVTKAKKIVCNLVIDEMSIRNGIIMKNGEPYGFVDLGFDENEKSEEASTVVQDDTVHDDIEEELEAEGSCPRVLEGVSGAPPLAKKALVFMLVSLNDSWKCPFAYFLVDTISSAQLANLTKKGLALLHEHEINVHSLTFDGMSSNLTAVKILGANLDIESKDYKPYFLHPTTKHKVYVIPDPCHMLKNIRNAFHDYSTLFNGADESIQWKYILDLVDVQLDEKLQIANKVTRRHANYKQNVMNVRLATQTLSNSTKDSLLYLKDSKTYGHIFRDAEATATFCKRINDAFDILNVRSRYSETFQSHKIPLNAANEEKLKRHVKEITEYIKQLKIEIRVTNRRTKVVSTKRIPVIKSRRKCGFVGMIIALKNIFDLFNDLRENYGQEYLLTYKLLQDHLENFFCAIRIKGGFNNNPDAFQFRCAYRRLLLHHDVIHSKYANCESDDIPILCVSFAKTDKTKCLDDDVLVNYEKFDFENLDRIPSEVVYDVVTYISGFITMKILQKKYIQLCPECIMKLGEDTSSSHLIELKNRGGLKEPTENVFSICWYIERVVRKNTDRVFLPGFTEATIQEVLANHIVLFLRTKEHAQHDKELVRLIASYYLKLRLRHEASILSEVDNYIRRTLTKLIIFRNQ